MKNTLKVDWDAGLIIMDRTFAKNASNVNSDEYATLQRTRQDYENYKVIIRTIAKNSKKETYAGLTYNYMENYIITHEKGDDILKVMDEYNELRLVAECHSKSRRYPVIKRWFLAKYPEIAEFGLLKIEVKGNEEKEEMQKSDMQVIECEEEKIPA